MIFTAQSSQYNPKTLCITSNERRIVSLHLHFYQRSCMKKYCFFSYCSFTHRNLITHELGTLYLPARCTTSRSSTADISSLGFSVSCARLTRGASRICQVHTTVPSPPNLLTGSLHYALGFNTLQCNIASSVLVPTALNELVFNIM